MGVASDYTWVYEGDTQQWRVDQSQLHFLGGVTERPSIRWRLIRFLRENRPDLEKKITCERLLDLHDEEYPLVAPW